MIDIHAFYHGVLEYHPPPGLFEIIFSRGDNLGNRVFVRYRHNAFAVLVRRRVQRESKRNGKPVVCKSTDVIHESARRQRNIALAYVKPVGRRNQSYKLSYFVVIVERLSAAHKHDISHGAFAFRSARVAIDAQHLRQYLARRKISYQSVNSRSAERTAHSATDLRGHAQRIAVALLHKCAFDNVAVAKPIKIFDRAVARQKFLFDLQRAVAVICAQLIFEFFGQRSHFVVAVKRRNAVVQLSGAITRHRILVLKNFGEFALSVIGKISHSLSS